MQQLRQDSATHRSFIQPQYNYSHSHDRRIISELDREVTLTLKKGDLVECFSQEQQPLLQQTSQGLIATHHQQRGFYFGVHGRRPDKKVDSSAEDWDQEEKENIAPEDYNSKDCRYGSQKYAKSNITLRDITSQVNKIQYPGELNVSVKDCLRKYSVAPLRPKVNRGLCIRAKIL